MQFSDRSWRQRYAKLHRVVGRIYVAGAFIRLSDGNVYRSRAGPATGAPLNLAYDLGHARRTVDEM